MVMRWRAVSGIDPGELYGHIDCMSLNEVIQDVEQLTPADRAKLAEYLQERARRNREDRLAQLDAAMRRMDEGKGVPFEKLKALHEAMVQLGL
jgi:hypothetical protein